MIVEFPKKGVVMKLVIEHSKTKRVIDGAFGVCGSREDLAALAEQVKARLADESWSYGWVSIHPALPLRSNTTPKTWDA